MTTTVPKIGKGTEQDPIRPDTTAKDWQKVSETDTTMTIEILD
jgi:hypothetical protein